MPQEIVQKAKVHQEDVRKPRVGVSVHASSSSTFSKANVLGLGLVFS